MKSVAFLLIFVTVTAAVPRVDLEQGSLRGTNMWSRKGRVFYAFQGIPYAAPPIENLRFKPPAEAPKWSGEFDARTEGNSCLQIHVLLTGKFIGDEDCLYLNVYTPKLENEGSPLSVMVFIHGGGFIMHSGGNEFYGPHFLLDRDIVLVTINYRLGALGFLSLGTKESPGNYGLKDQVAALHWVQKNIAKFGGNPNSVTIFGQSAGAASVHYLMLSPLAKGLFHRAILQSGSAYNPWAMTRHAPRHAHELARALGCSSQNPLKCLQTANAQQLVKIASEMHLDAVRADGKRCVFSPTIEPLGTPEAFLSEDPRSMLARGDISNVPVIAGLNTHEGVIHLFMLQNQTMWYDYYGHFDRFLPQSISRLSPSQTLATSIAINKFYSDLCMGDFLQQYIKLNSDVDFVLGVDEFVRGMAALRRSPVFYYQFSYNGRLGTLKNIRFPALVGTAHGDEIGYLFSLRLMQAVPWSALWIGDTMTIERITTLWTNFATHGHPTPDNHLGVKWKAVHAVDADPSSVATRYLDIGANLEMKADDLNGERIQFWRKLTKRG